MDFIREKQLRDQRFYKEFDSLYQVFYGILLFPSFLLIGVLVLYCLI